MSTACSDLASAGFPAAMCPPVTRMHHSTVIQLLSSVGCSVWMDPHQILQRIWTSNQYEFVHPSELIATHYSPKLRELEFSPHRMLDLRSINGDPRARFPISCPKPTFWITNQCLNGKYRSILEARTEIVLKKYQKLRNLKKALAHLHWSTFCLQFCLGGFRDPLSDENSELQSIR